MDISVEQSSQRANVSIMRLTGDLDGSNYRELIDRVRDLHQRGTRGILLDMTNLRFMSSAGLVALHTVALLLKGSDAPDPETAGWRALRAVGEAADSDTQQNVRLLNPNHRVSGVLERSGVANFFPSHTDEAQAVEAF
jgi:hypothetical protein